jgi:hypothetical protein
MTLIVHPDKLGDAGNDCLLLGEDIFRAVRILNADL